MAKNPKSKKRGSHDVLIEEDKPFLVVEKGCSKSKKAKLAESPVESESDSMDEEVSLAVEHATRIIASMRSLEAVGDVLQEVKSRIQCLIYSGELKELFSRVLRAEDALNPFKKQERNHLSSLFQSCAIDSHEVFKDKECTLSNRREVCGASTTLLLDCGAEAMALIMTWYWCPDEELGYTEEFSLVRRPWSGSESGNESDCGDDVVEDIIVEGTRSPGGGLRAEVNLPVLRVIHARINRRLSLQTLLRFLVLCSRAESAKCQAATSSVTHGLDADEDAEDMCRFLAGFTVDPAGEAVPEDGPSAAKGSAAQNRPRGTAPAPAAAPRGKKARRA